jgi:molybdenum cofactor biosynthesis protein B
MGCKEHKDNAPRQVRCAVLTMSDTKDETTDESGRIIRETLALHGHTVDIYKVLKDDFDAIHKELVALSSNENVDAIITTGGTGITSRDVTIDAVAPLLEKELDGFGELFRMLSYKDIGSAAMLSRSLAGVTNKKVVICLPGSPKAVRLAMDSLVIPELSHLIWEANR